MAQPTTEALAVRVNEHGERLDKHEIIHKDLWKSINGVRNRLPHWATILIAVLTAVLGALLGGAV